MISVTLFILASRVPKATAPDLPGGGRESSIPGTLIERCDRSTSSNWGTLTIFHADENIQQQQDPGNDIEAPIISTHRYGECSSVFIFVVFKTVRDTVLQ